jgi:hypothetical protein
VSYVSVPFWRTITTITYVTIPITITITITITIAITITIITVTTSDTITTTRERPWFKARQQDLLLWVLHMYFPAPPLSHPWNRTVTPSRYPFNTMVQHGNNIVKLLYYPSITRV